MEAAVNQTLPEKDDAPVRVTMASPDDAARWNAYVLHHRGGSFFHLFGWSDVVNAAYGYEPVYLIAQRGEAIAGVLPVIDVRAPLLGRSVISTAFTVGGGPLGDNPAIVHALTDRAAEIAEERAANYIELRTENFTIDGWRQKSGVYATFDTEISSDDDENLKRIPRRRRAEIRKAMAAENAGELCVRRDLDSGLFYRIYARSMRDHGTPVFPRRFLDALCRQFAGQIETSFVDHQGKTVAGLLSFTFKNRAILYYTGAAPEARGLRAHELIYWAAMRRAAARGLEIFDFGRSKVGSGPYKFKSLWGIEPTPLTYHYKLINTDDVPNINPNNPKFTALSAAWRRMPLAVANKLGPVLAPNFP